MHVIYILYVCVYIYIYIRRPRQTQGGARQGIRHSTFRVEMQQQQQQQQEQEQESADPGRRKGERARE